MTILKQELIFDKNDPNKTTVLRNTFDCQAALDLVSEENKSGGGRMKDGMRCIGHIPPEMWMYDPWLVQARKAQRAGDMGEFHKYLMKFFDVHSSFKVITRPKYYSFGAG